MNQQPGEDIGVYRLVPSPRHQNMIDRIRATAAPIPGTYTAY